MKQAITMLKGLKDEIHGIEDLKAGLNFSGRSNGFEVGLTVTLSSKEALEEYGPHPKHQEVVSFLKEIGLEELIAVDFEC